MIIMASALTPNMVKALESATYRAANEGHAYSDADAVTTGWNMYGVDGRTLSALVKRGLCMGDGGLTPAGVKARTDRAERAAYVLNVVESQDGVGSQAPAHTDPVIDVVPGVNGIDLGTNSYNRFIGVRVDENGPYTYGLATAISRAPGMNGTGTTNVRATFGDVVRIEGKRYTITDNRYGTNGPRKGNPTLVPVITEPVSGVADCTDCGAHIMVNDVTVPEQCEDGCDYEDEGFEETGADGYGTVAARIAATGPITLPLGNVVSAIVSTHATNGEPFEEVRKLAPWSPVPGMYGVTATGTLEKMINHDVSTWGIYTLPNGDTVAAWYFDDEVLSVFVIERGMTEYYVNARIEIAIPGLDSTITEYEGQFLCSADPSNLYLSEENEQSIAARYVESREWPASSVAAVRVTHMTHVPW